MKRMKPYRVSLGARLAGLGLLLLGVLVPAQQQHSARESTGPYERQIAENVAKLGSPEAPARAQAAEALGFLRAFSAEAPLIGRLADPSPEVRRHAVMALGWCGGRAAVPALLAALDDGDWATAQAAHAALTNLTGMELPFNVFGPERRAQAEAWRAWWTAALADRPPTDVLALLGNVPLASAGGVTVSSAYKGPPEVLRDGQTSGGYWQTKNVRFPQWCMIDLGSPRLAGRVVVHQFSAQYGMIDYELAASLDGQTFEPVVRRMGRTPARLVIDFPKRQARYIRITCLGSAKPQYPTTFYEIEVEGDEGLGDPALARQRQDFAWRQERGLRALGALGGRGATAAVMATLGPNPPVALELRPAVKAGIRALGRLREEAGFQRLIQLLDNPVWARNAAEALGDFGDRRAVPALLAAYPRYAKDLKGVDPADVPPDDKMTFPSEDRMLETPHAIAFALSRLPLDATQDRAALRQIAPLLVANLPGDYDAMFLYEPEAGLQLTRWLLDASGMRQEACEQAFTRLGQSRRAPRPQFDAALAWPDIPSRRIATWLPCVCTEKEDLPRLLKLLEHKERWVRINASKAIAWLGDKRAVEPVARILAGAKAEADYGYAGKFKMEEYNDPSPRWRQGLLRILGLLGAHAQTGLIASILEDERSVLDVRLAAAEALNDLGNAQALAALRKAAAGHPFASIRNAARDALHRRGMDWEGSKPESPAQSANHNPQSTIQNFAFHIPHSAMPEALVFIKGDNDIPNTSTTVEQADRWRQTYVVTDEGPEYRPGDNLFVLRPPRPDGTVTPLTRFTEGWVASPEVSWDASHVIFTRRGKDDPWWHVWRINVDGSGLRQLTFGPYHDIQPTYLPDGRIVFASSRVGTRDEYHGYPCTALWVMNADGSALEPIATNIGRDNEPAILNDGRIVFSRLEVFYSRNKTELTLHAMNPDGTRDVVLYGPERREFWRKLDHGQTGPDDGQEAPLTHRVLRITQPQPMPDGRSIIVSTQGGLTLIGPRRDAERLISPDYKTRAYTTPWPLADGRVLCASTIKTPDRKKVDLGLYILDPDTQKLELVYNDPATADYEARPILARRPPPVLAGQAHASGYSGEFLCASVFTTREPEVRQKGRFIRLIEGIPQPVRHTTQNNDQEWPVWANHGGTLARVLGVAPLAPDGSFRVEAPADRLLHFQVLDSDRRVVGNQITWINTRPGEIRSCVGCHENPHNSGTGKALLQAAQQPPLRFLPTGEEFRYRAKAWMKGSLPAQVEEQTRTVRAVNLLGRP